ncbi:MAG: hypothetical protein J6W19_03605 [Prevotella sp.]|nr:hypothetical protein [Prevotella sp.]
MKTFKLTMMAAMLAFAGTAMAQEKVVLTANDLTIANGEEAELVINADLETDATICGANFSLYLPEGILLKGFASKDEQMKTTEDGGKGSKRNYSKACSIDEECVWGEDGDNTFIYDFKAKSDGEGLLIILLDSDKLPFVTTKGKLITITVHAIADVKGEGQIKDIGFTDKNNVSVGIVDGVNTFSDISFGVNQETVGINEIQSTGSEAPAYNLQGIRVNNAKGLIIRDGKKMIVK